MEKNSKFLKEPHCKIQTLFDGNFVESQAKGLKIIKKVLS